MCCTQSKLNDTVLFVRMCTQWTASYSSGIASKFPDARVTTCAIWAGKLGDLERAVHERELPVRPVRERPGAEGEELYFTLMY